MQKFHVKKGDDVVVLAGKEKGKQGKIIHVFPKKSRVVVEGLQSPFGDCDETHRNIQGGKPTGCLDQMMQMIEVDLDVLTAPNSTNRRNEPNGGVRFDHGCVLAAWRRMGEQCPAAKIFWQGGLTVPLPGCF